jgi:hypothetical protein
MTRGEAASPSGVRLAAAIDEYPAELGAGRRPDRGAFLARYPELGAEQEAARRAPRAGGSAF